MHEDGGLPAGGVGGLHGGLLKVDGHLAAGKQKQEERGKKARADCCAFAVTDHLLCMLPSQMIHSAVS